ncbi:MAG TPA: GNAT family N-acyltransferase [Prolixibacteraceae bacterium]|nr:GNAT family N-acyltransferase [Prolixibacteraceae bacterium]HPR84781.1 GNAT family N-acyltransferase [Prolixibacteraceae bacterium]
MELFKPKDILKANPKLSFLGGEHFARFLMLLLRFDKLNRVYNQIGDKKGLEFIDELLNILEIKFLYDSEELQKRFPKTGPVVVVGNHPFGGLEGILLIKMLSQIRSDVKIMSTHLLQKIDPISEYFIEEESFLKKNITDASTEKAAAHLDQGGVLCFFPAGEVSQFDTYRVLTDKQWQYPVLKFIKQQKAPVVPIHFQGNNSRLFYWMGNVLPALKEMKLPTEILYQHRKPIKIRIGNPVSLAEQDKFNDIYQYGRYLRAKTYLLCSKIEVKRFFNYSLKRQQKIEPVADALPHEKILEELKSLNSEHLLFRLKSYSVYCVPSKRIPNILLEIGRLRELTFRQVGEGTNRSIDLDEFDLYYHQMFIWDEDTEMIAGAYRIGKGADILHQYGVRGFYIQSLFKIKDGMQDMLKETMELGRSFVVKEYQRKPMPLFLLWKGILYFTLKNPEYRYLMGPVSVSDDYSTTSKEMIIKFIMTHHFDWKLARSITPRNSYKFKTEDQNLSVVMETMDNDINSLDKLIDDVDESNSGLPVLLKKYIKLNAKIIGFNVDPKFNNCLDGLIVLDLCDVPVNTIESLSKEANDGSILQQFYSRKIREGK